MSYATSAQYFALLHASSKKSSRRRSALPGAAIRTLQWWSHRENLLRFDAWAAARYRCQVQTTFVICLLLAPGVAEHDRVPGLAFGKSGCWNLRLPDEARARAPIHTARHDVDNGNIRVSRERPQGTGHRGAKREPRKHGAGHERCSLARAR